MSAATVLCTERGESTWGSSRVETISGTPRGQHRLCGMQGIAVARTGSLHRAPSLPPRRGSLTLALCRSGLELGDSYLGQGGHGEVHEAQPIAGVHLQSDEDPCHQVDVLVGTLGDVSIGVCQPRGAGTCWDTEDGGPGMR